MHGPCAELDYHGIVHFDQVRDLVAAFAPGPVHGALADQDGRRWDVVTDRQRLSALMPPGTLDGSYHVLAADCCFLFGQVAPGAPGPHSTALFIARQWRRRPGPPDIPSFPFSGETIRHHLDWI